MLCGVTATQGSNPCATAFRLVAPTDVGATDVYKRQGVEQLRTAWDRVPKARQVEDGRIETYSYECTVRMNLALGLEKQGDAAMASDRAQAAALYKEMGEVVSPCQSTSSTQNQQNQQGQGGGADADKAHDRAKQKHCLLYTSS